MTSRATSPQVVPARVRRGPAAALAALACAAAIGCAADDGVAAAPYVAPPPGTVYDYGDFSNTVTASDGWRTTYTDDRGREGRRVALFMTEDPSRPITVEPAALDSLWPLRLGRRVTLRTMRGEERDRWEFSVLDTATVTVPAGTFQAIVVEGVQTPELVHSPEAATSVVHTWWYAPEVAAVVQFQSAYVMGPAVGRRVEGRLQAVRGPGTASAAADSAAAAPPAAAPGP